MVYKTAYNPGDSPVVVSETGRSIGGREWGTVQTTDSAASALLDAGYISIVDYPEDSDTSTFNTDVSKVITRTDEWTAKHEKVQGTDKQVLLDDARQRGLIEEDEDRSKGELVTLYTETEDLDVPTKTSVRRDAPSQPTAPTSTIKKEG